MAFSFRKQTASLVFLSAAAALPLLVSMAACGGGDQQPPITPPPPPASTPDAVFSMNEDYPIPASGEIPYQFIEIETKLTEDKWVQAFEVKAGDFVVEMQDTWHYGINNGSVPVKLLVIDQVPAGAPNNLVPKTP